MKRLPYRVLVQQTLDSQEPYIAHRLTVCAMQETADQLQAWLRHCYQIDLPFVIASLEMAIESIRASMTPDDQQFADQIKNMVVCATITLSEEDLQEALKMGDADQ